MNAISKWAITLTLLAGTAYGQVPSTNDTSDAKENTGVGSDTLGGPAASNGGSNNTAIGFAALNLNQISSNNTAVGYEALFANDLDAAGNAVNNTAIGYEALYNNGDGNSNTAAGAGSLSSNTTGSSNTGTGAGSLGSNTTGGYNSAYGADALSLNISGGGNSAFGGCCVLVNNTSGNNNSAFGTSALSSGTTGSDNTALGASALYFTTGSGNTAVGYEAGYNVTTGSKNIEIGNEGVATDNGVTRIGTKGSQKEVFIAGIENSQITGSAVYVTAAGRLGVLASSERYKTAIEPMGANTAKLGQLRPVTFKLKTDAKGTVQYGLIAEEVDKVYPELVIRDEAGKIQGVRYDELAPMLLNETQKEHSTVATLVAQHEADAERIASLERKVAEVDDLKQQLSALILELKAQDKLVAQR